MAYNDRLLHSRRYSATRVRFMAIAFLMVHVGAGVFGRGSSESPTTDPVTALNAAPQNTETAVLAGGCFWGVEAVFERLEGVQDVVSGYSGGSADTASYYTIGSGTTGHAESVQIVYDPTVIRFEVLLQIFFNVAHDPTQLNYQGPDVGPQYRSIVFYADREQQQIAEGYIKELDRRGVFAEPIVTQVAPLKAFYPAEEYHQDFMRRNPQHPYIVYWDLPKILHLEETYPELLAKPIAGGH